MKSLRGFGKLNRLIVFVLVTALLVTCSSVDFLYKKEIKASSSVASRVDKPRRPGNVTTWDCVYFGHYYQTKVGLNVSSYQGDYFPEPIKWRVIDKDT